MKFGNEMNAYPAHPSDFISHVSSTSWPYQTLLLSLSWMPLRGKGQKKRRSWFVYIVNIHDLWFIFFPSLFRSLRPRGLIEERAPWPCAGRQGFMPTRRKRTMNNKLPSTQKLLWCLGSQETKKSTHQSILMEYLLKCEQTPQSLCRPEAAMTNDEKSSEKKPTHQTLETPRSQKREDFFFFLKT